ncbi:hypothetical protein EJ074_20565 [Mesorhizobium sp. M3A.F.Ca.ET.080.04.2.1]|uniref:hypothetical protein n=1 Tax=Mesorhizobium sp. M3A.F.Ca.ET.080.04.2.1 TaxID=2493676 RepID=UPI000F74E381|nr:hypothetical protein [Mesorhizobium sp. M3A.F.Ca.ET.080.04.2.1]AZO11214.1 hypothetical protein EJ074_20565 [Mesorhizobium sp. M3A.F.Ca.ET.080.04.2.1]RWF23776.1 MAG: hypothetical protein EOS64_10005 [Mesorhizobium sp.]
MTAQDLMNAKTLMGFWAEHKRECRPIGDIVTEARAGALPGVKPLESGFGFRVTDEAVALNAMRRA